MWADLDDHAACEDGSVISWDSRFWGVTRARARQRDPNLPCASLTGQAGRLYLTPPTASRTTTTSSPVIATSLKHTLSQSQVTVSPVSEASGTRSTEQPTDHPASISSQTEHPSVTPSLNSSVSTTTSTNATPPTTLSPVNRSTDSPAADGTPSYTVAMLSSTVPATTVTANRDPDHSPVSPVTSDHRATSDATSHPASSAPPSDASPTNQIPTSTQTSPITTLPANQTTPPKSLTTGSPLVNCDITRLCSNEHAYYWMFLSVKATGTNRTETDVHDWVSNVFSCDTEAVRTTTAAHDADMKDLCQGGRKLQILEVSCDANKEIRRANCSLLLQLSHAVSVCKLQHALQRARDEPLQARLIGEVERVGRELCEDVEPSSGGFVRCTSSSSLGDICQSDTHSGLTCSFIEPGSTPLPQPERESCSWEKPRFCDCTAFCRDTRQFFALSINISSPTVDVNFIENMLSKLGVAPACDTMSE
ncbi:mucin-5AC-like [Centroberyx affinis]|uniref:mucin-5AC-like n=1 Tax=Centroberyx affinis TaxID=166261 RepID=UPI003A5C35AE